jgi:hypothetical protein
MLEPRPNDPDPDGEPFGDFLLAAFRLACILPIEEETTSPHTRLACVHLQCSLLKVLIRLSMTPITISRF